MSQPSFEAAFGNSPGTPGSPGPPEKEFHLGDYVDIVRRHWKLTLLLCMVGAAAGYVRYQLTPKAYRTKARIQIERKSSVVGLDGAWTQYLLNMEYYPTQYALLQSRGLAERTVKALRLFEDPQFNPSWSGSTKDQGSAPEVDDATLARLGQKLQGGLSVTPIKGTHLVDITYRASSAELTAKVANGVAATFAAWRLEKGIETVGKASTFLAEYVDNLTAEIQNKEARIQAFGRDDDADLDPSADTALQRFEALNRDYVAAVSERIGKESRRQELRNRSERSIVEGLSSPRLTAARNQKARLEADYADKLNIYKPEWPAMVLLKEQIDRAQDNLNSITLEVVNAERQKASTEHQSAVHREQNLLKEINAIKENMGLDSASVELTNLKVELDTRRKLLDDLIKRQSETEVAVRMQNTGESNIRVVDRALVPGAPFQPSLKSGVTGGLTAGLGLSLLLIFLIEFMDRTIKSGEDAEARLGLPVLGVIPDMRASTGRYGYYNYNTYGEGTRRQKSSAPKKAAQVQKKLTPEAPAIEFIPLQQPRSSVSEAYRSLRTALLLSSAENLTTIAVTSAQPGEGKTSTAVNLGIVMAQLGKRVLLIDADLRKPRIHKVFKVPNRDGLVSCLTRGEDLTTATQPTQLPSLFVLPSGPVPPNPSELLASERMRNILRGAQERFDFIILDTPPILPVSDAVVVGAIVDGTIVCLQAGKVPRDEAVSARDRLLMGEVKILGIVLNFYKIAGAGDRKRHYYYYQAYGETGESEARVPADSAA